MTPTLIPGRRLRLAVAAQALALAIMIGGAAIALTSVLSPGLARPEESKRQPVVLPPKKSHTDHSGMMKGPFADGPSVTSACLGCHQAAGQQMLHSAHFTWLGEAGKVPGAGGPGHDLPQRIGKRNLINNFCLSIESNWPRCTNSASPSPLSIISGIIRAHTARSRSSTGWVSRRRWQSYWPC